MIKAKVLILTQVSCVMCLVIRGAFSAVVVAQVLIEQLFQLLLLKLKLLWH